MTNLSIHLQYIKCIKELNIEFNKNNINYTNKNNKFFKNLFECEKKLNEIKNKK